MDNPPDRCLICYSSIAATSSSRQNRKCVSKKGKENSSDSILFRQLKNVFILKKLLEIPAEYLQSYLIGCAKPEIWVTTCAKCDALIEEANNINYELVETSKRFRKVQKRIIEAIKISKCLQDKNGDKSGLWKSSNGFITEQSRSFVSFHEYRLITNPFILGDERAAQLATSSVTSASPIASRSTEIKTEVDLNQRLNPIDEEVLWDNVEDHFETTEIETDLEDEFVNCSNQEDDVYKPASIKDQRLKSVTDPMTQGDNSIPIEEIILEETKFCEKCGVNFFAKAFDKHTSNLHKQENFQDHLQQEKLPESVDKNQLKEVEIEAELEDPSNEDANTDNAVKTESVNAGDSLNHSEELAFVTRNKSGALNPLRCSKCPRKFYHKMDLVQHQNLHQVSPFHCYVCLSVHKCSDNLRYHIWKHHPATRTRTNKRSSQSRKKVDTLELVKKRAILPGSRIGPANIKCSKCTRYVHPDSMNEHLELHEKSPYQCTECGNVFVTERKLRCHLGKYHRKAFFEYKKQHAKAAAQPLNIQSGTRKSSRQARSQILISKPDESDSDGENLKTDKDADWNPDDDDTVSTSRTTSSRRTTSKRKRDDRLYKRKFLFCPSCSGAFKFRATEVEKLIPHLEVCEAVRSKSQDDTISLKCGICEVFKTSLSEQVAFCEHLRACNENHKNGQSPLVALSCRLFQCNLCPGTTYFSLEGFLKHFMEHSKNVYHCTKCPKRFPVTSQVQAHWRYHHQDANKTVQPLYRFTKDVSVPEVSWWCKFCNEKFTNEDTRDAHIHNCHRQEIPENLQVQVCQRCSKAYSCEFELKVHNTTAHAISSLTVSECDVCNLRFATKHQLRNHRMKKHRLDLLVCETCGMECNSFHNLAIHRQLHEAVKKCICQQCDQSFTTNGLLKNHIYKEHTPLDVKINPLVCMHCDRVFYNKTYLNQHIARVHTGEFKMFCELCNVGFFYNSKLVKHMALKHQIGESSKYKFPCTVEGCGKVFNSPGKLKQHLARHAGTFLYSCRHCGKGFSHSSHLRRHEYIHTNAESKPYVCEICAKRFPVRNYLYIHMKSHRKDNM